MTIYEQFRKEKSGGRDFWERAMAEMARRQAKRQINSALNGKDKPLPLEGTCGAEE
jgi:hypothetical protein